MGQRCVWRYCALYATAVPIARAAIVLSGRQSDVQAEGLAEQFEIGTFALLAHDEYFDRQEVLTGFGPFNQTAAGAASVPTCASSSGANQNMSFSINSVADELLVTGVLAATPIRPEWCNRHHRSDPRRCLRYFRALFPHEPEPPVSV